MFAPKTMLAGVVVALCIFSLSQDVSARQRQPVRRKLVHRVMDRGVVQPGPKVTTARPGLALQRWLASQARGALDKPTFDARNSRHAKAVGFESGLLAARASGITDGRRLGRVIGVFTRASAQSGSSFAGAFTPDGKKVESQEATYKQAMNAAGPVASSHLVALAHAITGKGRLTGAKKRALSAEVNQVLRSARVEDIAKIVARDLGKSVKVSGGQIIRNVQALIPKDDWAYGDIAKMKARARGERPLNERQLAVLSGALRLANATWKAGQVHRAAWEGNNSRITPSERGGVYNPYDVLKVKMFNDTQAGVSGGKRKADQVALSRVVFEVFKDLKQLTPQ